MSNRRVNPGDRVEVSHRTWNDLLRTQDAVRGMQRRPGTPAVLVGPRQTGIVWVKNNRTAQGGDDGSLAQFSVLGIDGPIFTPTENATLFRSRVVLKGTTPAAPTHAGKFVVLLEPLRAGLIGRGYIDGVCPARVRLRSANDAYADVINGDASSLQGGNWGAARIIWAEPLAQGEAYPIVKLCIVQLGMPHAAVSARVTGNCVGGGKYNGKIAIGRYAPTDATWLDEDLALPEQMTLPQDDDCIIVNVVESGFNSHILTAAGSTFNLWHKGHVKGYMPVDQTPHSGKPIVEIYSHGSSDCYDDAE